MHETALELRELDALIQRSYGGATDHLRGIINEDRTLSATQIAQLLSGVRVLALGTVTSRGEPRVSAVDGHFLHGAWVFTTSGSSAKAEQLARRTAASAAHIDHEALAVFCHGHATRLTEGHARYGEALDHLTQHYGGSPLAWGDDIRLYRLEPAWLVGYAFDRERLLRERGVNVT
jgi:hypothetical protein